jgi:hypothetical protein
VPGKILNWASKKLGPTSAIQPIKHSLASREPWTTSLISSAAAQVRCGSKKMNFV